MNRSHTRICSTNFGCDVGYAPASQSIVYDGTAGKGGRTWRADIVPQPVRGQVQLHVFLDRSIIEVYTGGAALTTRCLLPKGVEGGQAMGVDAWAVGGSTKLLRLEAWKMGNMWGPVSTRNGQ